LRIATSPVPLELALVVAVLATGAAGHLQETLAVEIIAH